MESKIKNYIRLIFNNYEKDFGSFKASQSKENPNYQYHWIRDSILIVDILLKSYQKGFIEPNYFTNFLRKFIDFEKKISKINILSGLGEPKFNLNGDPYLEDWGRPQNDGPALRILLYLNIIKTFPFYKKELNELISKNVNYLKHNINKKNFDLWEEVYGFHFYTSYIQLIALHRTDKEYNNFTEIKFLEKILDRFMKEDYIVSSIEVDNYREFLDTSVIMSFLHTETDPIHWKSRCSKLLEKLKYKFKSIYKINEKTKIDWFGRYSEDSYFDGNPWIICTVAKLTFEYKYKLKNKLYVINQFNLVEKYLENLEDYPEQICKNTGESKSALFLTWNYVEILRFLYLIF